MTKISTLAIEINEETYSIAVACLPPSFALIPFAQVERDYLVINELRINYGADGEELLTLGNHWMDRELFHKTYFGGTFAQLAAGFTKVERIG